MRKKKTGNNIIKILLIQVILFTNTCFAGDNYFKKETATLSPPIGMDLVRIQNAFISQNSITNFGIDELLVEEVEQKIRLLKTIPFISTWHNIFEEISSKASQNSECSYEILISYMKERYGKFQTFKVIVPYGLTKESLEVIAQYLSAYVNNLYMIPGIYYLDIQCEGSDFFPYISSIKNYDVPAMLDNTETNARISSAEMQKIYHEKEPFFMIQGADSIENGILYAGSKSIQEYLHSESKDMDTAKVLGIEIGQTKTRLAIVNVDKNGKADLIGKELELWTWEQASDRSDAHLLFERIIAAGQKLAEINNLELDGIGITIAARVKDKSPVNIPLGVVRDFHEGSFEKLVNIREIFSQKFNNIPCVIENDGNAQAKGFSFLNKKNNLLLLRFGTTLCAGYIDKNGDIPRGFGEFNKVIIDMTDNTDTDPYYRGKAGNYISFKGIIHVAKKLGIVEKYSIEEESSIPGILKEMLISNEKEVRNDASLVYEQVGEYIAEYLEEVQRFFHIENVALVGFQIKGRASLIIEKSIHSTLSLRKSKISVSIHRPSDDIKENTLSGIFGMSNLLLEDISGKKAAKDYQAFRSTYFPILKLPSGVFAQLKAEAALNFAKIGDTSVLPELINILSDPKASFDLQFEILKAIGLMATDTAKSFKPEIVRQLSIQIPRYNEKISAATEEILKELGWKNSIRNNSHALKTEELSWMRSFEQSI